ncbi:hypothetical protein [Salinibacter altiplanensis]|uniref:hypothetical protein n=1 Tax=Salinibacter altiplanensis TaxID=1803181 RepID=UPI000C9EE8CE|nr:hypothetical protein [Salinibacter altiplanensis]
MPTASQHPFSDLSNDELKEKEQTLRSEISRLGDALEEERQEAQRLKKRLRKGDSLAEDMLDDVNETINELQADRSRKRARLEKAQSMRRSSGRGKSASGPNYGV